MSDLIQILPQSARKHYINLRNMRDSAELTRYQEQVRNLKSEAAAKGMLHSGWFLSRSMKLQMDRIDAMVYGHTQDALATCDLYDVPLTEELCTALEDIARQTLAAQYRHVPTIQPLGGIGLMPVGLEDSMKKQAQMAQFKSLPTVSILIETARIADQRRRTMAMNLKPPARFAEGTRVHIVSPGVDGVVTQMSAERAQLGEFWHEVKTEDGIRREPGSNLELIPNPLTNAPEHNGTTNYIQNVHQHGLGSSASQFGHVTTSILNMGDVAGLKEDIRSIRAALKAQPESLECDEALGHLATAERAATNDDKHGLESALGKISKGGWELIKSTVPTAMSQVLLHYLKVHGLV